MIEDKEREIVEAVLSTYLSYISVFIFRLFHTRKYLTYKVMSKEFVFGSIGLVLSAILMYLDSYAAQVMQAFIFIFAVYVFRETWFPYIKMFLRKLEGK